MAFLDKLKKGETVECMLFENGARVVRRDLQFKKVGSMIYDDFVNEAYAVVTRPLLNLRGKKSGPVYFIDRDAGCTVELTRIPVPDETDVARVEPEAEAPRSRIAYLLDLIRTADQPAMPAPEVQPANTVIENPKEIIIDGKRFAGWTVELRRSRQVLDVTTNPELIGRALKSTMFANAFGIKAEMRQVIIGVLIGLAIGTFIVGPMLF